MTLSVTKIMRKKPATCFPDATIYDAAKVLKKFGTSAVVVVNKKKEVLGIFTERDLVNKIVTMKKDPQKVRVSEVMTSPVICADVSQTDVQVSNLIITKKVKKIPVLKNGKLVGVVAESDLLRFLAISVLEG